MPIGPVTFALRAGPLGEADLWVARVEGRERLSEPYLFAVEAWPRDGEPFDCEAVLGREAVLTLRRAGGEERVVHGEAHAAALVSIAAGRPSYRIVVAPRLARLGLGARSRVFQERTVPEIAGEVLSERGIAHRLELSGSYPRRDMVVQHRESDLAFVSRLLEAEGIWYRFEHADDGHELVLADGPGAYRGAEGPVAYRPDGERGGGTPHVFRLDRTSRLVPGAAAARSFDFERPALDLSARSADGDGPEVHEWPGGYLAAADGRRLVGRRLEELRHGAEGWDGRSTSLVPAPGSAFELEGAPRLLAVGVVHRGEQEKSPTGEPKVSYENAFEAIDAGRTYRPRRRTPAPWMGGIQTATVTGPAGEEVHTDRHGRVKVRFHWDREGAADERSSAWVRVADLWAGAGMGSSFIPRIGQEVVIRFLDGDPDRPIVVGAVYNGANVPPADLPGEKTRSTVRTASSPGSGGYNELRLEDEAGREEVLLHAQKDREVDVEAEEAREVRASSDLDVGRDRERRVLGSQRLDVGAAETCAIGGSEALTVALARSVDVAGAHEERVGAAQAVTVAGAQDVTVGRATAVSVGAAAFLNVGGAYVVNVAGAVNELVAGLKSSQIAGQASELVGGHREERIAGDRLGTTRGDAQVDVDGAVGLGTGGDASEAVAGKVTIVVVGSGEAALGEGALEASGGLKLVVGGKLALAMTSGGEVLLGGAKITVEGSELALKGGAVKKVAPAGPRSAEETRAALADLERTTAESFLVTIHLDPEDPATDDDAFVLLDEHGAEVHRRTTADDTTPGDHAVTLEFTDLEPGKRYSLLVDEGSDGKVYVFEGLTREEAMLRARAPYAAADEAAGGKDRDGAADPALPADHAQQPTAGERAELPANRDPADDPDELII